MIILGIHPGHDASLALIKDGRLVHSTSMERFSRRKKSHLIKFEYLERFLYDCEVELKDIDYITMSFWNQSNIEWMRIYAPLEYPYPLSVFGRDTLDVGILNHLDDYHSGYDNWKPQYIKGLGTTLPDLWDRLRKPFISTSFRHKLTANLNVTIDGCDKIFKGYFVDHHTAHASSAFYTSPFEKSAIFTVDATGREPDESSGMFLGYGQSLQLFKNPQYMYGAFYDVATEFCGLGPGLEKAGVLMGLAAYGHVSKKSVDNWKEWTKPYSWRSEREDVTYDDWLFHQISGKFPYIQNSINEEVTNEPNGHMYTREFQKSFTREESTSDTVMDIAADIQYIAERSLVDYSQQLFDEAKGLHDNNLCVAGGTFLNCNANYKILKETGFERMHMFPACGDDGLSAGSALYVTHQILRFPRVHYQPKDIMYLGYDYVDEYPESIYEEFELDIDEVASQVSKGKIICWYQGRAEMGPRALGNRSFICDARNKDMKDIINSRVKYREWYRPFAPVVLNEHKEEWFRMDFESPYMLFTVPSKRPFDIPSGVHIDNSARVQTLRRTDNPRFYDVIDSFYKLTGVPVVMNTSLNIKGRPIVETPYEAMHLFEESDVDLLVINDKMYYKNKLKNG